MPVEVKKVRCNVRQFRDRTFELWRCVGCQSLHCEKVDDLASYYANYPIREQTLDAFVRSWYRVILRRLLAAGLRKDHRVLDYGCNQGLFLQFMAEQGYARCVGYDPYVEAYRAAQVLEQRYDFVVSLDVIEHDADPRAFLQKLVALLAPGGALCVETPNAEGILLKESEEYLHAIHAPYHEHILSQRGLEQLIAEQGLVNVAFYDRWYMDSWLPGAARKLFERLMLLAGNDLDSGYEKPRFDLFWRHPSLIFYLFFGYFLPSQKRDHMMVIARPRTASSTAAVATTTRRMRPSNGSDSALHRA